MSARLKSQLEAANVPNADNQLRWIIEARQENITQIQQDVLALCQGKPLSRILGFAEFYGRRFDVSEDTLDPRPDTELIIDIALKRFKSDQALRILDLGTGTGCLIVSLLAEFPKASGVATDLSQEALYIAQKNSKTNHVDNRCDFYQGDWFQGLPENIGEFDLIVSNPPYISSSVIPKLGENVQKYDPILALDGGKDGLQAYKGIFSKVFFYLKSDGIGLFEIGFDQKKSTMRLAGESRLLVQDVHADYTGNQRVLEVSVDKLSGDK